MLTPTTKLEAVNYLLSAMGEMPVNALEDTQVSPVSVAENEIDEVTRNVQSEGFNFNTDEEYPLIPDAETGEIKIPSNVIFVDATDRTKNITVRQSKLYNKKDHTYKFDEEIKVDIVWMFEFEELPQHVRHYITVRAGRSFQAKMLGSELIDKLTQDDEYRARVNMVTLEEAQNDYNLLDQNPFRYGAMRR